MGSELYEVIRSALLKGKKLHISFYNISDISTAFLDSAIGELYNGEFSKKDIQEKIKIRNLSEDDKFILDRVVERAEDYFKDPKKFELIFAHDDY